MACCPAPRTITSADGQAGAQTSGVASGAGIGMLPEPLLLSVATHPSF